MGPVNDTRYFFADATERHGGRLKSGRTVAYNAECFLQCEPGLRYGAFVEETAYERYAVRDTARRRKLWDRAAGVGGPVGARFGDFDETGAHRERGMAGEICDRQHFVAKRWDEQQIDLRKNARHFLRYFSPQTVRLHKIYRRQESRLAKNVGPRVVGLHFQLIYRVIQRDFFKGGRAFREQNQVE